MQEQMEKIPSNVIIKTNYFYTKRMMSSHFFPTIIERIIKYIKDYPKNYENLEIEAKLGRFEFEGEFMKNLEKINEIFVIPDNIKKTYNEKFNFVAGVCPRNFFLIWSALEKEAKLIGANIECIKPIIYKDTIYKTNKRKSEIFQNGKLIKEEIIRKEFKENINVRNNGFDFRITCSKEMPTEIDEKNDEIENVREKYRMSYQLSFYRVDLTLSKDKNKNEEYYEVEIEMNLLKKELIGVKQIDENKIRAILDRFIQNIFNLYSVLMPEAIVYNAKREEQMNNEKSSNKHLNDDEIKSIFGNYFKNNLYKKDK